MIIIRHDNLSTAVAAARVHTDKYKEVFDVVIAFITQYVDKRGPTSSVKVVIIAQTIPVKWQNTSTSGVTFKGKIELKKFFMEEYQSMLMAHLERSWTYKRQEDPRKW